MQHVKIGSVLTLVLSVIHVRPVPIAKWSITKQFAPVLMGTLDHQQPAAPYVRMLDFIHLACRHDVPVLVEGVAKKEQQLQLQQSLHH
jgi:hypothetical protein